MSSTYRRPPEPLVDKNYFRERTFYPQQIRPFSEALERLPIPVIPDHSDWVEMYWRAWEIAWQNLRRPNALAGFISSYSGPIASENVSMWETAFNLQYGLYGRRAFYFLGSLDNFYAKQHDDGFICREINEQEGYDFFEKFGPGSTGPNVLAWAEWRYYRQTADENRLRDVFYPLLAYHRWLRQHRTWRNGTYWATGLSSGMGNQQRVPSGKHHHDHYVWADANIQASINCLLLGQIGQTIQAGDLITELAQEREYLLREINESLWDEGTQFFHDADPTGRLAPLKSIGSYWALHDKGLLSPKRLEGILAHLKNESVFGRSHPIPTIGADSHLYNGDGGDHWQGGVWSPTNYVVLKGLRHHGWHQLAHHLAKKHMQQISEVYVRTDTLWEYYAADSSAPGDGACPNYVGWTGLSPIAMLIEDIIGIHIDWPLRRVFWDRRLDVSEPYGVQNLPVGPDGLMSLMGDDEKVTVETTVPFTLTIQDKAGRVQLPVSAGKLEIEL